MKPPAYKPIITAYDAASNDVRTYFKYVPDLARNFPFDICLSYLFTRVEQAQRMSIYCGIVKLHRADTTLTRRAVDILHMSREDFHAKFKTVFGEPLQSVIASKLEEAEKVRDNVLHGKNVLKPTIRKAIVDIVEFADDYNDFLYEKARFRPFGSLQGFKGRAAPLDKSTTRWLLKGIGLSFK
ncbi:MAG: hypothetical protein ABI876_00400 [Bacteroidota bacterium]